MKKLVLAVAFSVPFLLMRLPAHAQEADVGIGFGTITTPATTTNSSGTAQQMGGGLYPSVSANIIMKHRIGFGGEVSWRARQNLYFGLQPFRPILYDFNAVWAPNLGKRATFEAMGGIGGESLRFYTGTISCSFVSCTDYVSSNHFLEHVGAGIRYQVWHNFFIRPEAHYYHINNNTNEFSSDSAARFAITIGYALIPEKY